MMRPMPSVSDIKIRTMIVMGGLRTPMTYENLRRMALRYETAYRRHRRSLVPPDRRYLLSELRTARAFYSLAREAQS